METQQGGGETNKPILVAKKNDHIESHLVAWKTWFSAIILGDQLYSPMTVSLRESTLHQPNNLAWYLDAMLSLAI